MNSEAIQALETHCQNFADEATGVVTSLRDPSHEYIQLYRVNSINKLGTQVDTAKRFSKILRD